MIPANPQQLPDDVDVLKAMIAAAHAEMDVHAVDGHPPRQPLVAVDVLIVPRRRRDDAVGISREGVASGGRE